MILKLYGKIDKKNLTIFLFTFKEKNILNKNDDIIQKLKLNSKKKKSTKSEAKFLKF